MRWFIRGIRQFRAFNADDLHIAVITAGGNVEGVPIPEWQQGAKKCDVVGQKGAGET